MARLMVINGPNLYEAQQFRSRDGFGAGSHCD